MNWRDRFRRQRPEANRHGSPTPIGTKLRVSDGHDSSIWTKGQSVLGEYTVEGVLGEGGMGTVFLLVRSHSTGQRFAVKKTKFRDETIQRNFLRELQLWLDLPEHPHLVACRFFRTIDEELAIFAEYVEGGALSKWIVDRRLAELPRILDVAIQFAWGLHALHEQGLVHQDVKPGNVLMTNDGVAKVSDFGLARARAATGEPVAGGGQDILLSCGGMTEAYCSPEQAAFQPLTRKTDIWSWGVSVLEMFTGGVTWASGVVADQALDAYVDRYASAGAGAAGLPLMPVEMVPVLRKCFRTELQDRWHTMLETAEALGEMYREYAGSAYPRKPPEFLRTSDRKVFINERATGVGAQWQDPRHWLEAALKAEGRDPAEAEVLVPLREGSRRAQAVADLAGYDGAQRIFERLVANGRTDLAVDLAFLLVNSAFIHQYLADAPGALAAYDRALAIQERLVNNDGRREFANHLAVTYTAKAVLLDGQGAARDAVTAHDCALAIQERLVNQEGRREFAGPLAESYVNKGNSLQRLGDFSSATNAYDRALAILEQLVNKEGRRERADTLAKTYSNKGVMLRALGDAVRALAAFDRAVGILEPLVNQEERRELANDLASVYAAKGNALSDQRDLTAAVAAYNQAVAIQERLVNQEGRWELANNLAMSYMNKGRAMHDLGDAAGAVAVFDRALGLRERLVNQEGRRDLAPGLALTYMNKGLALEDLKDRLGASAAYDHAVAIYKNLVEHERRQELRGDLARVQLLKAYLLADPHDRASEVMRAMSVLKEEVQRTGRADLKRVLNLATNRG
jgi:tetratricopeptide (TPR) repeat protein